MAKSTDVRPIAASVYFFPIETRVPLKFGPETVTFVTCARVRLRVENRSGRVAEGWGETPLSVQWVWPSSSPYEPRHAALKGFSVELASAWAGLDFWGHPIEVGHEFQVSVLPGLLSELNEQLGDDGPVPWLAALVCCSAFDLALHDAYGVLHEVPSYETYNASFMSRDLGSYLEPLAGTPVGFDSVYPEDFLTRSRADSIPAWHLVGGKDLLSASELDGSEPDDGYPVLLPDWIECDGIRCLKVKLTGVDSEWDYERLLAVGRIAIAHGADWLSADFNCTVTEVDYVNDILDRLVSDAPRIYGMILYVEQPFPYDLQASNIDVHSCSARKPLFMDESAHDWSIVRLGRELGWTGVALKTCKTQTGALLALSWARAHGMTIMVQDLTNPMLAQVPHVLLAAHASTIMGVETNSMQFYPDASLPEAEVHPGVYRRRGGCVDLTTIRGAGFGYRIDEIRRELPDPAAAVGR
ncbi:MAG: mandelate racemase/muconate lactonizing enzyme family protein [Planctomycetes bacterium]|nr:mandelate racemase/muconate lactonizing enzyme family protein [Planctomycetota bacterium]